MNMRSNRILQLLFLLAAAMVWPFLYSYINNPDSFQYIRLARYWADGNFHEAVNGYWSPMISWLLAPLLLTGKHPVLLFKFLQLAIAFIAFAYWCRLADRYFSSRWMKLAVIPLLLSEALLTLTPDLLFVTVCLAMLDFFLEKPVWNDRKRAVMAGIVGAVLYLSKAFGFPLFLCFALFTFWHHRNTTTGSTFSNLLVGLMAFSIISSIWISSISCKYGHFTLSEAVAYNSTREVTGVENEIVRLPILYDEGLVAPHGTSALSAWEEPMQSKPMQALDPLRSESDKQLWLSNLKRNFLSMWYFDFRRQAGGVFLIMSIVFLLSVGFSAVREQRFLYPFILMSAVYVGYGLILYHARYSWICTYLMLLMSGLFFLKTEKRSSLAVMKVLMLLMLVLVVKRPVKEILFSQDKEVGISDLFKAMMRPRETMETAYQDDLRVFDIGENLRCIDGPFASRHTEFESRPRYFSTLMLAERCVQPYLGQIDDYEAEALSQLKSAGVRYLLVWDDNRRPPFAENPVCSYEGALVYRIP